MATKMRDTRWAMGLGIRAGKALVKTENALSRIMATGIGNDLQVQADLRAARCELGHLARRISDILRELERDNG